MALLVLLSGCEPPSAPEFTNIYDSAYDGGPFDFSVAVGANNSYQLLWRDNSPIGVDYSVTRIDLIDSDNSATLEIALEDRSLEDQLPSLTDAYEYYFELTREQRSTTANWTVVGYGMESFYKLIRAAFSQLDFSSQPPFNALTGDGNILYIWAQTENRIFVRDLSDLTASFSLEFNADAQPTEHTLMLSPDNRILCSHSKFISIGVDDIRCWDAGTGEIFINEARVAGNQLSLNRPGYVAIMSESTLEWWNFLDGQLEEEISNIPGTPIDVTPDGTIAFITQSSSPGVARPMLLSSLTTMPKAITVKPKVFSPDGSIMGDCSRTEQGVDFYDTSILLDNSNPAEGLITSIPRAMDCSFSPDGSEVFFQHNGLAVDNLDGLVTLPVNALSSAIDAASIAAQASLFIPHGFDVTDVTWTSDNRLFTTGENQIVQEWSFTPAIRVPRTDTLTVRWQ